jgi:hypothetical protein
MSTVTLSEHRTHPLLVAAAAGLSWGVACMFLQELLPGPAESIVANSGAGWAVLAFVAGAACGRGRLWVAASAGALLELGLVVGYYASAIVRYDQDPPQFWAYVWAGAALVAGPVFGIAGAWWRTAVVPWRRISAIALLGGLFAGEGVLRMATLSDKITAWIFIVAGLVLPMALGRGNREKLLGLLGVVPAIGLALAGFAVIEACTSVAS